MDPLKKPLLHRLGRYRRPLILALLGLGFWRLYQADFWRAEQFRPRILAALEEGLGRRVEVQGPITYRLWGGLGFSAAQVIIHEDPHFSPEPFAYVGSLDAALSLPDLFTGRLRFGQLLLDEPSLNLARGGSSGMNVLPLVERALAGSRSAANPLPDIQVRNGRLNFVLNRRKSVFYLRRVDLVVTAADESTLRVTFEGEPARTDRRNVGFGRFTARGRIRFPSASEPNVDLDLDLDRSNLGEVASLFEPKAVNLNGRVDTEARLQGPVSAIRIEGRLTVDPLLQRDLLRPGPPPLNYSGLANLREQTLLLTATPDPKLPASARIVARDILQNPRWAALIRINELPAVALIPFWRSGSTAPLAGNLDGKLTGAFSIHNGLARGMAQYHDPSPDHPVGDASLLVDGPLIEFRAALPSAPIPPLRDVLATVTGFAPGFLADVTDGAFNGSLEFRHAGPDSAPSWSGIFKARSTLSIPGINGPISVDEAEIRLDQNNMTVESFQAKIGKIELQGSYRYEADAAIPHRFTLLIPRAEWPEIDRILDPTLRPGNFLSRTLGFPGATLPDWIASRKAEGSLRLGALSAKSGEISPVKARLRWNGPKIDLTEVEAGSMRGDLSIELTPAGPKFQSTGTLQLPN